MLSNYALYKKLERSLNEIIAEMNRETLYHVGKVFFSIFIVYSYRTINMAFFRYWVLFFLCICLLLCFKIVRNLIYNFWSDKIKYIKFIFGTKYEIKDVENVVNSFLYDYTSHVKDLVFLRTIFRNTDSNSIDLYVLVAKNELLTIRSALKEIKRIIDNPSYHHKSIDVDKLTKRYTIISAYYKELVSLIVTPNGNSATPSSIVNDEVDDIRNMAFDL